jgi:hypothetical protein
MGNVDLSLGYGVRGVALTTHPLLALRLKKGNSYTSPSPN